MPKKLKKDEMTLLAEQRTDLAKTRTVLAFVRTATALILFGIAFLGFADTSTFLIIGGGTSITVGLLFLLFALAYWFKHTKQIKKVKKK